MTTNYFTECKSKFSSTSLDKIIRGSELLRKKEYTELSAIEDYLHKDNLIIYHRRESSDTFDKFSVNEDNFLDKSFIHLMNSVTIVIEY